MKSIGGDRRRSLAALWILLPNASCAYIHLGNMWCTLCSLEIVTEIYVLTAQVWVISWFLRYKDNTGNFFKNILLTLHFDIVVSVQTFLWLQLTFTTFSSLLTFDRPVWFFCFFSILVPQVHHHIHTLQPEFGQILLSSDDLTVSTMLSDPSLTKKSIRCSLFQFNISFIHTVFIKPCSSLISLSYGWNSIFSFSI